MKKQMFTMLGIVGVLIGSVFAYKGIGAYFFYKKMAGYQAPPTTVSAIRAEYSLWQPEIKAAGSVRAQRGVNISSEVAGMVQTISFTPGAVVAEGAVLVQLNADNDKAQLNALNATAGLAQTTYLRNKAQYAAHAISKATLDTDLAELKNKQAQAAAQAALVAKKTIRAPFSGRLGISLINPGQYVKPGEKMVTLQTLDPIYVDFFVPQQALPHIKVGQAVNITLNGKTNATLTGSISTINPIVDVSTRNVEVEATLSNPDGVLVPGMFVSVHVIAGDPVRYITLPQTAISFNSYGNLVYLIDEHGKDPKGHPIKIAKQSFVTLGDTRGDQVALLKGVQEGDWVVTSGQLKLKKDAPVTINNSVLPANNPSPTPTDH